MFPVKSVFVFVSFIIFTFNLIQGECPYGCPEPTLIYSHLNCNPIFSDNDQCCPDRFDCSQFLARPKSRCHVLGRYFKKYAEIPNELVSGTYSLDCRCYEFRNKFQILCASLLCPEFSGKFKSQGCFPKYNLHNPCAIGEVCPFSQNVQSTIINGVQVFEHQKFNRYPCKLCVYQKGYNNSYPFCKESCMPELTSSEFIDDFCAPVYITKFDCCPIEWICPNAVDTTMLKLNAATTANACTFGDIKVNVGTKFQKGASTIASTPVECECRIPPFITCYWKNS